MRKKHIYQICSPSLFLSLFFKRRALLNKYITLDVILDEYNNRFNPNLSIYDGIKGLKYKARFRKEIKENIYNLLEKKLKGIQSWSDGLVEITNNEGFNEIIIKKRSTYEADQKLKEVLDEIKNHINSYSDDGKIHCRNIIYYDVRNNEIKKH